MDQWLTSGRESAGRASTGRWRRLFGVENMVLGPRIWALLAVSAVATAILAQRGQPVLMVLCVGLTYVGLLLLVGASTQAAFLLLLQTALLDHYNVRFAGINLRPEWVAAVIALAITLAAWRRRGWRLPIRPVDGLLLAWLALNGVASLLFAPRPLSSLRAFLGLSLVASGFFVVRYLVRADSTQIPDILLAFGAAVTGFGVFAYLVSPLVGSTIGVQLNPDTHVLMAYGTLWEADIFGAFAAFILLLSVSCIILRPDPQFRLAGINAVISALALEVSLARTAWIAAALGILVGLLFWVWLTMTKRLANVGQSVRRILPVVGVTIIASLALWLVVTVTQSARNSYANVATGPAGYVTVHTQASPASQAAPASSAAPVLSRFDTLAHPGDLARDSTLRLRLEAARLVIADWRHEPLFGRGTASFGQVYTDTSHQPWWIFNIGLRALHDTGIVGLAVFLLFAVSVTLLPLLAAAKVKGNHAGRVMILFLPTVTLWLTAQATEPFQLLWPWLLLGMIPAIVPVHMDQEVRR